MISEEKKKAHRNMLVPYLEEKGIDISCHFRCLHPDHEDRNPSMAFDYQRNKVHCFSCGFDGDIYDLIGVEYGCDTFAKKVAKVDELQKMFGGCMIMEKQQSHEEEWQVRKQQKKLSQQDEAEYYKACNRVIIEACSRVSETDYFRKRGLSDKTVKKCAFGYHPSFSYHGETRDVVILPIDQGGFIARVIDDRESDIMRYCIYGKNDIKALWERALVD